MRICIVIDDYLPGSVKVAAKMMHELALEFVSRNHEVTVVTPGADLSVPFRLDELDRVKVLRFRSGPIKNISKFKRLINEVLLSKRSWKSLKNYLISNPQDYIIYYSPSIFWGNLTFRLKRLWRVPSYLILRDFFPQWIIDNGLIREKSLIAYFFEYYEKLNYRAANRIGIQSPANMEWFAKKFPEFKNIQLLYNWATNSNLVLNQGNFYRKRLNLEDKVVFFYGGNIGQAQDMRNILRLAKRMQFHSEAHFLLVGAGDEFDLVKKTLYSESISNVTLLDSVSQEEYKKMLSEFDVGLFTLSAKHQTHNFPGKILEYMRQRKPILGSVNPGNDLQEVIHSAGAGFVSISGQDKLFYENAFKFLNPKVRKECGKNSESLLKQKFSVNSAADMILSSYEKSY
ncbi:MULTISPECIES: glycosyltransferase family 4 protein [Leptospira]|uniref:Glycosyltransferase, group 1 family protein n=2 Tax=Leptospira weilii TaxID=28184 RepID=A0A828Z4Y0_9LEPT|nr:MULTISPECIES: glycosyltransferase family 4 protein [Leptospira]EKR66083.1 glycosyltransferase, group 1 family protein [Leptospira weilii str. 2006001853]EMN46690.1 glycosyltransferase, group 1 family protein [Leptospira weilii str. LNT 1234]